MFRSASPSQRQARRRVAGSDSVVAPIGGWNARDPLANMKPEEAVVLDEIFPRENVCELRGGVADHVTGFGAVPKTLALYTPPTASNKMFASTDAAVYDVTSPGVLGASVASCTNGYWNWEQMGVSGGHYLMLFNGTDKPLYYNGAAWVSVDGGSVPAITVVTTTNLVSACVYKRRLLLVEKNKLSFWYLPVDSVGGAAAEFTLGPLCHKGGFLMAIGTWTVDGGNGQDDLAVFVTSEGEAVIFTGTDPGSSTAWSHVGTYAFAKPIGRKCLQKYAGDLVVITENGVLPLSKALTPAQSAAIQKRFLLTDKIDRAFADAALNYRSLEGWECSVYDVEDAFIFNIPKSTTEAMQFVMNTGTKAWCRFLAWQARAFAVFNKELYFADTTKIGKAWSGTSDYGANIVGEVQQAFNYFRERGRTKEWTLLRPNLLSDGPFGLSIGLAVDFEMPPPLVAASYAAPTGAAWDSAIWDTSLWGQDMQVTQSWQTPRAKEGYAASYLMNISTNSSHVQWVVTDYIFTLGEPL